MAKSRKKSHFPPYYRHFLAERRQFFRVTSKSVWIRHRSLNEIAFGHHVVTICIKPSATAHVKQYFLTSNRKVVKHTSFIVLCYPHAFASDP